MYNYHFHEWLSFFYFYCIFGWCFESVYVSVKEKRAINRGFLKGPWLPLYGSGAILVLWLTLPFRRTPLLVFVAGALGATALEFVTGETMVRLFRVRYWDYSNQKFQYKGHICLTSTIAWGFLSLLMVYAVHQPVEDFIFRLNEEAVSVLTFLVTVCMVYDFAGAFRKAMDLRELLLQAELLREELERRSEEKKRLLEAAAVFTRAAIEESLDEKKENIAARLEHEIQELRGKQERLKERMTNSAGYLLLHNPGSRFMSTVIDAGEIREKIRNLKKKTE